MSTLITTTERKIIKFDTRTKTVSVLYIFFSGRDFRAKKL